MRVRYGTPIEVLAKVIKRLFSESDDPSQDALIALALAYRAVQRLEERGVVLEFNKRPLALLSIRRAYREVLHLRKGIDDNWLDTSFISKFGRLQPNAESKIQNAGNQPE
jgi:hypothetical protein